jgi:hypothetical protein
MLRLFLAVWATGVGALAADPSTPVTFTENVLPILQKNCQSCHRPGQVAADVVSQLRKYAPLGESDQGSGD